MNNDQYDIKLEQDGETILIKNIKIRDEKAYVFLHSMEEKTRIDTLIDAVKIGINGLKHIKMGAELNYVENGFNEMINKFNFALNPNLPNSFFYNLVHLMKEYYDRGGRIEHLLDPSTQNGPLNKLQNDINGEFQKLRDIFIRKEAEKELIQKTPLKGSDFENTVEYLLAEYTSTTFGDNVVRTTRTCGNLTACLSGDFVLIPRGMTDNKIAIEAKDIDSISEPQIISTLEQAMKNRGAKYGIFLVKYKEALPKKLGWFHELSGNILVCAMGSKTSDTQFVQIPSLAIEFAKLRLQKETDIQKETIETISDCVILIGKKIDRLSLIQTQCTNIERSVTEIREQSRTVKNDIAEQIVKIRRVISSPFTNTSQEGEKQ